MFPAVLVAAVSLIVSVLMWFLWITTGSGNANFYFFQTLIFSIANAYLILNQIHIRRKARALSRYGKNVQY